MTSNDKEFWKGFFGAFPLFIWISIILMGAGMLLITAMAMYAWIVVYGSWSMWAVAIFSLICAGFSAWISEKHL